MAFTVGDISAAMFKANGQTLASIKNQSLNASSANDLGGSRKMGNKGAKQPYKDSTGHAYAHIASFAQGAVNPAMQKAGAIAFEHKSQWLDRQVAIAATLEMMNSPQAQAVVQNFLGLGTGVPSGPERVQAIPLTGKYYGYPAATNPDHAVAQLPADVANDPKQRKGNREVRGNCRLVESGTVSFFIAGGSLYIYTSYPEKYVAGHVGLGDTDDYDTGTMFS